MTPAEASDILDDLRTLDGMWEATRGLEESLQLIVLDDQAAIWPPTDGRWAFLARAQWEDRRTLEMQRYLS